jgi:hypothetical protein
MREPRPSDVLQVLSSRKGKLPVEREVVLPD